MIINSIYWIVILIGALSIPTLVHSIRNKERIFCIDLIKIDITYLICLFIVIAILPNILSLEIYLDILLIAVFAAFAVILCLLSIIINLVKMRKKNQGFFNIVKKFLEICVLTIFLLIIPTVFLFYMFGKFSWITIIIFLLSILIGMIYIISVGSSMKRASNVRNNKIKVLSVLLILPLLILYGSILRNKYIIDNSDYILIYYSRGNGGFGDGKYFNIAIKDDSSELIELGTATSGYNMKEFISSSLDIKEITNLGEIGEYRVTFADDKIKIYRNESIIFEMDNSERYFNVEFKKGFHLEK